MACSHASYGLWHDVCPVPVPAQLLDPEQDSHHGAWALKDHPQGCGCHPDPGEEQQNQLPQQSPCSHTRLSDWLSDLHSSSMPEQCRQGASTEERKRKEYIFWRQLNQQPSILYRAAQGKRRSSCKMPWSCPLCVSTAYLRTRTRP